MLTMLIREYLQDLEKEPLAGFLVALMVMMLLALLWALRRPRHAVSAGREGTLDIGPQGEDARLPRRGAAEEVLLPQALPLACGLPVAVVLLAMAGVQYGRAIQLAGGANRAVGMAGYELIARGSIFWADPQIAGALVLTVGSLAIAWAAARVRRADPTVRHLRPPPWLVVPLVAVTAWYCASMAMRVLGNPWEVAFRLIPDPPMSCTGGEGTAMGARSNVSATLLSALAIYVLAALALAFASRPRTPRVFARAPVFRLLSTSERWPILVGAVAFSLGLAAFAATRPHSRDVAAMEDPSFASTFRGALGSRLELGVPDGMRIPTLKHATSLRSHITLQLFQDTATLLEGVEPRPVTLAKPLSTAGPDTRAAFQAKLEAARANAQGSPPDVLVLQADEATSGASIALTLQAARAAGFRAVQLVTVRRFEVASAILGRLVRARREGVVARLIDGLELEAERALTLPTQETFGAWALRVDHAAGEGEVRVRIDAATAEGAGSSSAASGSGLPPLSPTSTGKLEEIDAIAAVDDSGRGPAFTEAVVVGSHRDEVLAVAWSPDGRRVASVSQHEMLFWDPATGSQARRSYASLEVPASLEYSPDGRVLAASSRSGTELWDREGEKVEGFYGCNGPGEFSPDSRILACAGVFSVNLWSVAERKELREIEAGEENSSARYSPDGRLLAWVSGGRDAFSDKEIVVWDVERGILKDRLRGHSGDINALRFSPDGRLLASGSSDQTVVLWDVATRRPVRRLTGHTGAVQALAFRRDGRRLAVADAGGGVTFWEVATGAARGRLTGHAGTVTAIAWSPDGQRVATGGADRTVRLWHMPEGEGSVGAQAREVGSVLEPWLPFDLTGFGRNIELRSDGRVAAAWAGSDATVHFFDLARGLEQRPIAVGGLMSDTVAFSADGRLVAIGPRLGGVQIWDLETGRRVQTLEGEGSSASHLAFSPDGTLLATCDFDGPIRLWRVSTGQVLRTLGDKDSVVRIRFTPDGRRLITTALDEPLKIWDVASGRLLKRIDEARTAGIISALSPDGRTLVTGYRETALAVWDLERGTIERRIDLDTGAKHLMDFVVAFSPDGSRIACGGPDGMTRVWEVATGRLVREFPRRVGWELPDDAGALAGGAGTTHGGSAGAVARHSEKILSIAFERDGALVVADAGWTVTRWSLADGRELARRTLVPGPTVDADFSPDGARVAIASGDGEVRLWDSATGHLISALRGHPAPLGCVRFSPDGSRVLAGAGDGSIQVWRPGVKGAPEVLEGHRAPVVALRFSPDRARLATLDLSGEVLIRDATSGRILGRLTGEPPGTEADGTVSMPPEPSRRAIERASRPARIRMDFSPDGRQLFAAGWRWELATGRRLPPFEPGAHVAERGFVPDGRVLARYWDRVMLFNRTSSP